MHVRRIPDTGRLNFLWPGRQEDVDFVDFRSAGVRVLSRSERRRSQDELNSKSRGDMSRGGIPDWRSYDTRVLNESTHRD